MDTNIIVGFRGGEPGIVSQVRQSTVILSSVVLGELFYGAYYSARRDDNLREIRAFAAIVSILNIDLGTAEVFGRVKSELRAAGTMIPENDIWIAATAVQYGLTLVTRDAHFNHVAGLSFVRW